MENATPVPNEQVLYNASTPPAQPVMGSEEIEGGGGGRRIILFLVGAVVILILLLFFFVFVLPRLGKNAGGNVTLKYWGVWEDSNVFAGVLSDFHQAHPDITVEYEKQDVKTFGKYVERLAKRIDNGTGPDVYRYHVSWPTQLKGYLLPFPSDVVTATELGTKYYPLKDALSGGKKSSIYYGLPLGVDTLSLFVNTDLFKSAGLAPPTTWDEFSDRAVHLTVKEADTGKIVTSGASFGTFDNVSHAPEIISLLLYQNGADFRNLSGASRAKAETALKYYTFFAKGDEKVWDDSMDNSTLAFARGAVAMYFGYSWDILQIKALNPSLNFAVLKVPSNPGGRSGTIASYWVEGVSAKTKHPKEAFEFIKFLSKRETLEKLYAAEARLRLFGELYPRQDMASLLSSNELLAPFLTQAQDAPFTVFTASTYDDGMNVALNTYLGNAVKSIVSDTSSVESAVETLASGVAQVLSRYEKQ